MRQRLRALGLEAGRRRRAIHADVPEIVAAFFAVVKIGGIVLPLFSGYGATPSARLHDAGAKGAVHRRRLLAARATS